MTLNAALTPSVNSIFVTLLFNLFWIFEHFSLNPFDPGGGGASLSIAALYITAAAPTRGAFTEDEII